jgi:hypothetical protein
VSSKIISPRLDTGFGLRRDVLAAMHRARTQHDHLLVPRRSALSCPRSVDAVFDNFAPGEVARQAAWVRENASPEQVFQHSGGLGATA